MRDEFGFPADVHGTWPPPPFQRELCKQEQESAQQNSVGSSCSGMQRAQVEKIELANRRLGLLSRHINDRVDFLEEVLARIETKLDAVIARHVPGR